MLIYVRWIWRPEVRDSLSVPVLGSVCMSFPFHGWLTLQLPIVLFVKVIRAGVASTKCTTDSKGWISFVYSLFFHGWMRQHGCLLHLFPYAIVVIVVRSYSASNQTKRTCCLLHWAFRCFSLKLLSPLLSSSLSSAGLVTRFALKIVASVSVIATCVYF